MTQAAETPSVVQAMTAVMRDVGAVRKGERNTQGSGYNFRGVDTVVNALAGPMRQHGVIVVPERVEELRVGSVQSKAGAAMETVHVRVSYRIYGPAGDWIPGGASGGSFDAGDKATPKAMSVAYRTFLLQAFGLPTDEPDPDLFTYERTAHEREEPAAPVLSPQAAKVIAAAETARDLDALRAVWARAKDLGDDLAMTAAQEASGRVATALRTGGPADDGVFPQQADER